VPICSITGILSIEINRAFKLTGQTLQPMNFLPEDTAAAYYQELLMDT
jgi:hypothetical protein